MDNYEKIMSKTVEDKMIEFDILKFLNNTIKNKSTKFRVWNNVSMDYYDNIPDWHNSYGYGYEYYHRDDIFMNSTKQKKFNKDCEIIGDIVLYEGDIILCGDDETAVVYESDYGFDLILIHKRLWGQCGCIRSFADNIMIDVLGNIYENPELLKVKYKEYEEEREQSDPKEEKLK